MGSTQLNSVLSTPLVTMALAQVDWQRVAKLETRRYAAQYLSNETREGLRWADLAESLPALFRGPEIAHGLEIIAAGKSLTWSDRDFNVYVGSRNRTVRSFLDLTPHEFVQVMIWHLNLAWELSCQLGREIRVTHGFNPDDTSPDAHSIAGRFHTHIYVPQVQGRQSVQLDVLRPFDLLAVIEPLSVVFYDRVAHLLRRRSRSGWSLKPEFGFFTATSSFQRPMIENALGVLHEILHDLHAKYDEAVAALTDGSVESVTGYARNVPRPRQERQRRITAFIRANRAWLSPLSKELMIYVALNLAAAEPRERPDSTRIENCRQLWFAKGFSGAFGFVVGGGSRQLRFDFAPRILSTSGAAKIIGPGTTLVVKDMAPASDAEQQRMAEFQDAAVAAATAITPGGTRPTRT